ncbi:FtsH-binding integral membrane protein [Saccharothrix tamanrassetensis]|uniref:FtsH-binding integral membrane protein n=1 Tax=Saccharothrix tamanrassetensis TaxID=1051531 RepID=A0A841CNM3_9PSEU|nr:hypothetical protein [Saccharothrix tamanrassetensis]MBB5957964.1 FtsH-binding integral membrane protein [Saccharothrix tamanrassetensis]
MIGAWLLLAAAVTETFGLMWDLQWHADVGPDTFFTAPHLMIYLGMAMCGLTSLTVVLRHTFRPTDARTVRVLGTFNAPLGFLVGGLGSAGGLLYGLMDLWWHTVYGFDATPTSPPHVALSLCSLLEVVGGMIAFAALHERRAARFGFAVIVGVACYGTIFLLLSTPPLPFVSTLPLAVALMLVFGLVLVAAVTRRPGYVTVAGLSFAAMQLITLFAAPPVTRAYAAALDLPLRDYADGIAWFAMYAPLAVVPAALVVEAVLVVGRRRSTPRTVVPLLGGAAAAVLVVGHLVQVGQPDPATVVAAAVLGVGAGWLGWRGAAPLRVGV